jgi:hypothetical protein
MPTQPCFVRGLCHHPCHQPNQLLPPPRLLPVTLPARPPSPLPACLPALPACLPACCRIAQELVETKLVWCEAQEVIVKLKRSLVKAQEKNGGWVAGWLAGWLDMAAAGGLRLGHLQVLRLQQAARAPGVCPAPRHACLMRLAGCRMPEGAIFHCPPSRFPLCCWCSDLQQSADQDGNQDV